MTILISSEVAEELEEVLFLARKAAPTERIVVHAPQQVLDTATGLARESNVVLRAARFHAHRARVVAKIAGLIDLGIVMAAERPRLLLSGFSMLKHRLHARVWAVPHISYIRGLMFNSAVKSGWSDSIRYRLLRGRNIRLFNAFEASRVLTVASINKDFMTARGVSPHVIEVVGPIWLRDIDRVRPTSSGRSRIFFITQAFEAHGLDEVHRAQVHAVRELAQELGNALVLRVHPRDYYDYHLDPALSGVSLDRSRPADFLANLTADDVLVSRLSTMAFEALYIGARVVFYVAPGVTNVMDDGYAALGIRAIALDEIGHVDFLQVAMTSADLQMFAPVSLDKAVDIIADTLRSN